MKPSSSAASATTLLELLEARAEQLRDQPLFTFVEDGEEERTVLSHAGLERRARSIGAALQRVVAAGERAVLLYPPGLEYVAGFFGCLAAGVVAVPAYPPDPTRLERTLPRLRAIIQDAQATVVLTTSFILSMGEMLFESAPDLQALRWMATDELPEGSEAEWRRPEPRRESLAFLQYTSGSTGTPKGVELTHGNLLHNLRLIHGAFGMHEGSAGVIWLPPYHDMGLIGGILGTLYGGFSTSLMSPMTFLRRPLRWLEEVSRTGGTISGGPNFAFDLCVRKTTEADRQALDLSRWEVAFCGAEPIRPETLERFAQAFACAGFRREAFYPCYGLAEGTLIVSGGRVGVPPVLQPLDVERLREGRVVPVEAAAPKAQTLVGSGESLQDQRVLVVHPEKGTPSAPGAVGEIWVQGPSVARGYWAQPEQTRRDFQAYTAGGEGPFLRTGDQGFLQDGQLFVTGRLKDLLIIRGRNHYPQDIELTVEHASAAPRAGCGAAFSVDVEGEERLALVYEVDTRRQPLDMASVVGAIRQRVAEVHELQVHALVFIEPGHLPKTSSGKIQRRATRAAWLAGELRMVAEWRADEDAAARAATPSPESSHEEEARPETPEALERWLRTRVASRLKVSPDELERDAPLTRYGVDSLAAVEVAYEVEKGLGVTLPMEVLLGGPSLAELAQRLWVETRTDARVMPSDASSGPPPLSFAQQRLWFLDQLEPGSPLYNLPAAVRLTGALDADVLARCFVEVVRRHEPLRTTFLPGEGEPVQLIHPEGAVPLARVDLGALDAAGREAEVTRHAHQEALRPFDLVHGPLLRTTLLRLSDTEHVLVLCMHHIASDGWSMGVLVREVAALYEAFSQGRPSPLPALPVRYADHARWQRERLQGEALTSQLEWWRGQLAGAPTQLELTFDRARPPVMDFRGASHPVHLSRERWERVQALARREGVTPFMLLLATFQTLLHRYSGQDDISVGSPIAGRGRAETEGLIGFFVNNLVLRTRLEGNPSFRELLGRVRETTLGAYAHQDVPFEKLVETLRPARDLSLSPLFQVMLILHPDPLPAFRLPGLALSGVTLESRTAKYDLTLALAESERGLTGSLEYATALYDAATVARMVEHLDVLLEGVLTHPEARLSELPLLPEAERRRVVAAWNHALPAPAVDAALHQLLERQVERTPEATVLVVGTRRLTYRELDTRANQLAWHLRSLGVGPEVPVALCLERTELLPVALFAILKAGGAYMPLDPTYPAQRLAFTLEDSRSPLLLTQRSLVPLAESLHAPPLVLLDEPEAFGHLPVTPPPCLNGPEDLAYLLYTSGSTGRPKGVALAHRSAVAFVRWALDTFSPAQLAGVLASTSVCFDLSVFELFVPPACGGCIYLADDALALPSLPAVAEVTLINTVPSAMAELVRQRAVPATVHTVNLCGEPLSAALAQAIHAAASVRVLYNLYGPTEDTTYSTWTAVLPGETATPHIGRPLPGTQAYVLDAYLHPVPIGVPGELYLGGLGLARGYLGRSDLTAERFVPDAFSTTPGARLYRTGDRVYWRADGQLEFLGRIDFQVKLRGFRIELGEVEAVLLRHASVRAAVALVREDVPGDKRLVMYAVPQDGHVLDAAALRAFVKQSLPEYMVPSAFVPMDAFPQTPNGKVDRKRLPPPEGMGLATEVAHAPPRTPTEERLATLWAQVLGVPRVGRHDDFFALGGHSLLATQVVSRLRAAFGVELPLRVLFEASTLDALAARLDASRPDAASRLPAPSRGEDAGPPPLSFAQQRLWFLEQLTPGTATYNMPAAVRLSGPLHLVALERSFAEVVRRHEPLRTTFRAEEGVPVQVIAPAGAWTLARVDLTPLAADAREAEALRLAREDAQAPFDLATGPLLRTTLVRLADTEHVLLLNLHHTVSDGWSLGVLVRELAALYGAFRRDETSPLAEPALRYSDYARWQRAWLQGEVLDTQLAYWKQRLAGAPEALALPCDKPRPAVLPAHGATVPVVLPREVGEAVKALCQREGVTPFMVLLAAFQTLLARASGQEDISVGTPIANRRHAGLEGLIGVFANTLVLRSRLRLEGSFLALLAQVRETTLGAYAHQDAPFEKLVDELRPVRDLSRTPLFQAMFSLQDALVPTLREAALALAPLAVDSGVAKFELTLELNLDADGGLGGVLEYNTALFDARTVTGWARQLSVLLAGVLARPEAPLDSHELLTGEERRQVLDVWSGAPADFPHTACVHELVAEAAARHPDTVAVAFDTPLLTYRELDARANRLAWHLRSLGVGPEVRVALCVERSPDMVVALLAILKAGGAWVALDPQLPAARLAFLLEDSGAAVLLTWQRLAPEPPPFPGPPVHLDTPWDALAPSPEGAPASGVTPAHAAYVIHTSGSTGQPKGVLLTHQGLANLVHWQRRAYALAPGERVLQFASLSFDLAVEEIFSTLVAGSTLRLLRAEEVSPGPALHALLQREAISVINVTPAVLGATPSEALPALRVVISGGEACTAELVARWAPGRTFINAYGPTEATVTATQAECVADGLPPSIGRPRPNVQAYVLDERLRPVPVGMPGELFLGGVGLARGYLAHPALTAEKFIPHPFGTTPGARLYRTGDQVRWRADGQLDYLGRVDAQVKVRGFRIEPGEVESALLRHTAVREAVVVAREDVPGERRLVAYYVVGEATADAATLRAFLKQSLPEYMVPSAFVALEALPLTPRGKVDRKALPVPDAAALGAGRPYTPPRDAVERRLAEVWAQVLGLPRVGIHDNFFELGGDSIISLQVVARARQAGLRLSARQLFQHQSIAELARVALEDTAARDSTPQGPVTGPVPLTPIQHQWLHHAPAHAHHFNQSVLVSARGLLEAERLREALQHLVTHHDALRLHLTRDGDTWRQHQAAPEQAWVPLRTVDLSALPAAERAQALADEAGRLQASFRLDAPPLLRAALFQLGEEPQRLLLIAHHLVVDGVSWRVLLEDLETAYQQLARGQAVILPPKSTSFQAWARHLERFAHADTLAAEAPTWTALAQGLAPLPTDATGPNTRASERIVSVRLDASETRLLLQETPGAWRARLDDVLLAALAQALGEWTDHAEVLVDLEGHGRQEALFEGVDLSRTVGWFTALTPVRLRPRAGGTPGETLRAVRDTLRARPPHGLGAGLLRWMGPEALAQPLRAQPGAPIAFNYLGQLDASSAASTLFTLCDADTGPHVHPDAPRDYVLEVNGSVRDGGLRMDFGYSTHLHTAATVERLAQRFLHHLSALIAERHSEDARRFSPGDFPLAALRAETLDALVRRTGADIEDVYPLSPLQHGLLFHWMLTPGSDVYLEQMAWTMRGALDLEAFGAAWRDILAHHPILRTSFHWEGLESPVQVVHARAELPVEVLDWREVPATEAPARFQHLLEEDRRRGFDPRRAPLMRLTAVRLGEDTWRFLWNHHHLLLDGWSLGLVFQDVLALYQARRAGEAPRLTPRAPFRDYITWLRRRDLSADAAFWRTVLTGFTRSTPLPSDTHALPPPGELATLCTHEQSLDAEATATLTAFSRQHQLTLTTLSLAAWALVLSRASGERDVLFGTTVSGRPPELPGSGAMVGVFINSLPIRVQLPEDTAPLLPWLQSFQARLAEVRQHESAPLVEIQSWSQVPRGTPLFESLLVVENFPLDTARLRREAAVDIRDVLTHERANYPLALAVLPGERLRLGLAHDAPRLRPEDMRRLLGHWRIALEGLVAHAETGLGAISLLSDAEREQVLGAWSTTPGARPEALTHQLIEAHARRAPDAPAVRLGTEALTYAELNARANQLARHLRRLGVGPEVRVALFLERSVERVVAMLAILKAGGAWLALEPSLPEERLSYIASDVMAPVLLTDSSLEHLLDRTGYVFLMDEHAERVERESEEDLETLVGADHLAYLIYTSGSTGRPKGTLLTHGGLANTAWQVARAHGYRPDSRVLQFASASFDASVAEVFSTLVAGACLCLARQEELLPSEPLRALLEREAITAVTLTPSVLAQLESHGLPRLETVISAGEACTPELARRWSQGRALLNAYGPTEVTVCATVSGPVRPERLGIGRALPQVQVYVLDAHGRPVPAGVAGELYVGGAGVARGYLGQPALTAERFVPHPHATEPGARLYRTGDMVRWREDGELEFLGRRDEQVKLRGFRIELGEVESVLGEHPAVAQAVVVAREDVPGDKRLVAYVVPGEGQQVEPQALRTALRSRLPEYMVPAAFVLLEALPLTTSGKVDRQALPSPEGQEATASAEYVGPRTDTERRLAEIWSEVLGLERVGPHDEFMALGGHSLLATQVASRIRARFGVELPLRELFESATLEQLARRLEDSGGAPRDAQPPPLARASREQLLPLSFAQQRLWFLEQLEPGRSTYNMPAALRIRGALDVAALERCLAELVRRHEVLRTTYEAQGGLARQVIHAPGALKLARVDVGALPAEAREAEALRLARQEAERPFELATGPLLRTTLVRLADTEHVLVVVLHHIVSDGWSITVLIQEMSALYEAFAQGRPSPLPELAVQYADYALWQRQWLTGAELERQLGYWTRQLAGAPAVLALPHDRPRPAVQTFRGASVPVRLSGALSLALKGLAQREGVTPFMLVLAAFQVLLHRHSGQGDISVGSPIAGRRLAELEGLVGFFVNSLVLRTRLEDNPSFRALLPRVRETTLGAYAHQDIPFEKLVDELRPERDLGHAPLFQVWFSLDKPRLEDFSTSALSLSMVDAQADVAKFDLTLFLTDGPEGIHGHFDYNTDLFDESTLVRMAGHLRVLLEGVVAAPDTRVSELPLLTAAERQRVLVEWNQARRELPAPALVHRLFEAQARRAPAAPAVCFGAETLTYAELNARANQLAHRLRRLGVGPEVLVAVCLERSVELAVALLAIPKAGGAWLPLDPTLPAERLSFLTTDAWAPVLLTHSSLEHLVDRRGEVILLDEHAPRLAHESTEDLDTALTADSLAYVIYTSGSTGQPKGTLLTHGGLTNTALQTADFMELGPGRRLLQFFSVGFDASVSEFFPALLSGACLVMASREELMPGAPLLEVVRAQAITTLKLTPSVLAQLEPEGLAGVRTLIAAGEACAPELVARWKPGRRFVNAYGPTECTVCATVNTDVDARRVTLGRPFHNVRAYVLDEALRPVPVGVPGELYIGGAGVARGYLGRPELTAERFVPDPFATEPGARLYRTGDMVRWLVHGELEYQGRADFQVKVRGFRIEPGEVESVLRRHPRVREALVMAREDVPGHKRLVAYVVAREGEAMDILTLRVFLGETLPEYMVPAVFVPLAALPLNSNGKVDRKALPAPDASGDERRVTYVEPQKGTERRLADLWAAVLGVERVGAHDNFFALGGDSIISIQVVARARQAGLVFATRDLFQHQTVAQLARVVKAEALSGAEQGPLTGPVPLTPIQRYLFAQDAAHAHHFNQSVLLATRTPLVASRLEAALRRLLGHHDALRLRLREVDGAWAQDLVSPEEASFQLQEVDLTALPAAERIAALEAEATRVQAGFVLAEPALLRAVLFQLDAGEQRLLLSVHHLAVDAVSWRVLLEDLESAYLQLERGESGGVLPPKSTSFQAWARRLEAHAHAEALATEAGRFWEAEARRHMAPLPTDATGPNTRASERAVSVALTAEETALLLREAPAAWRVQIQELLLAALAQALSEWTEREQVLVDVEGHGREELFADMDLSRTVGWFTSVAPLLLPVPRDASAGERLRAVRDASRPLPHHGLGHGLLRWMGPPETAARLAALPAAQVAFNYLGQLDATVAASRFFSLAAEPIGPLTAPEGTRFHVLEVNGSVLEGRLRVEFGYSTHLHTAATIERLAGRFLHHLRDYLAERHSDDARWFSPGDFPLAPLTPDSLEALVSRTGTDIEDIYPLSPTQQGMLFHAMLAPESGAYFEQLAWTVRGGLDLERFLQAWKTCLARHALLRSSFHWVGLESPLQVVHARAELPFAWHDWRELPASEHTERFARLTQEEKTRGFDLSRAPLTRLTAVRLTEDTWRFLWSHHHLLVDGWSLGVLIGEVFSLYATLCAGREPALVPPMPFRDYIAWLARRDARADEAWWRADLAGFTSPTPLPADTRAAGRSDAPAQALLELDLSPEATASLQAFARSHQLTTNTLALAAWALVLSHHGGERDVVFGNTVAGRPPELPGAETMVGVFINTLPTRVRIPPAASALVPWLQALQAAQVERRAYEHASLVQVQGWSQVPRGTPLFESLVVFENYPLDASALSSSALRVEDVHGFEATNYALTLSVLPGEALRLRAVYDTARFERSGLERVLGHWRHALAALTAPAHTRLGDVTLLSEAERHQVLAEWNPARTDFPGEACLHHLFEQQVALRPEAIALEFGERRLTYRELDAHANQLAHRLRALGVGPDALVALCLERSVELIVALLGILKAGGAYLPLDASYPTERLAQMLEDAPPRLLLSSRVLGERLPIPASLPRLWVEAWDVEGEPTTAPASGVTSRHLAYVDFTSGSTGRPKGVAIEHRAVMRLLHGNDYARLGPEETFLLIAPISFDASTLEVWGPLLFGGRLVVFPPESPSDLDLLTQVLTRHRVTTLHLTAGLFSQMVDLKPEGLAGVRQLLTGGDVVSAPHVRRVLERYGIPVTACYGPTEGTLFTSCHRMTRPEQVGATVPIGSPLANTQVYLLDAGLAPVGVGVPGELYIGGEGLARGYLSRPELTAERFVPHPFASEPGARLYRTGDLARWREDGVLEFLGRLDNQVKVRGYRIELGEVEAALSRHARVREAVAVVREDSPGDKRLVVYAVPRADERLDAAELRAFLQERLPEYMCPSALVVLETLPLTANAKVDRKALPAPEGARAPSAGYVAPRDDLEREVAALWAEVLGVERVGIHDDFLSLGGHSLLATKLVSRLRQAFQVELPLKDFFEAPTVATLALRILEAMAQVPGDELASMMDALEGLEGDELQQLLAATASGTDEAESQE